MKRSGASAARQPPLYGRAEAQAVLLQLMRLPPSERLRAYRSLPEPARRAISEEWWWQAHGGQREPPKCADGSDWLVWALVAARGFGKTRAGAEWVWARAREDGAARIALVAASFDEVAAVMVEGDSGLLETARSDEKPRWISSRGLFLFPSGARGQAFSAEKPDKLRGPQHHYAWCDELAKWPSGRAGGHPRADAAWDNLMLGLRLGDRPRAIVTTTPAPVPVLRRILALPRCARTHGRTDENPHNPATYREAVQQMYGGTRLGRQELEGLLLDEFEGALWSRDLLEKARGKPGGEENPSPRWGGDWGGVACETRRDFPNSPPPPKPSPIEGEGFQRIVIGLDPPASTDGNSCGIVICGKDKEGVAWVLADLTARGLSPEAWARRVAEAADIWGHLYTGVPAKVVAEKNQGGDMIESVLRAVDADLPIRLVPATKSKAARAEPIALRFETGRARLAGFFPELEDQLCALTWSGYQGPGSPDRADAMVWAMTELFEKERAEPRIWRL